MPVPAVLAWRGRSFIYLRQLVQKRGGGGATPWEEGERRDFADCRTLYLPLPSRALFASFLPPRLSSTYHGNPSGRAPYARVNREVNLVFQPLNRENLIGGRESDSNADTDLEMVNYRLWRNMDFWILQFFECDFFVEEQCPPWRGVFYSGRICERSRRTKLTDRRWRSVQNGTYVFSIINVCKHFTQTTLISFHLIDETFILPLKRRSQLSMPHCYR